MVPLISRDLHVPVTTAGLTVSLYAFGVMIGAPVLTALTSNLSRKMLLLGIMLVFILGNAVAAASTSLWLLLLARILSAFSHGVFMSVGAATAAALVPEGRKAGAISILFSGLTVAIIAGVPFGTYLGQQMGWRAVFAVIAAFGIVALLANGLLVPPGLRNNVRRIGLREPFKLLASGRILLMFVITALGYGGTFVVFTYLSPLLQETVGFSPSAIAVILLVYGVAVAIGNVIGGKVANRRPLSALVLIFMAQALVLMLLSFTLAAGSKTAVLAVVILMGLMAFMSASGLQLYVVMLAERLVPAAVDVASAVNITAFNAGIVIGSYLGGRITDSVGITHTPWGGALMVLGAIVLTVWMKAWERKDHARALNGAATTK
jgi:predicted MFS family arabinose efflux permease